jgi:tRNA (guanine26-N2/guanine27-N2)-dimethyltransferase
MNTIKEGSAKIFVPAGKVFYNPAQCVNRDLSVAVIKTYLKKHQVKAPKLCEALSATGLRSIRYAKELSDDIKITANDIDAKAVELINRNICENDVVDRIVSSCRDANFLLYSLAESGSLQDIIDLDPYGSASPFLDAALQAVGDGGLLCITCTDMAVLCSSYPESCYSKYGSVPVKSDACHEVALRIVLSLVSRLASKHKKYIVPLLSCSIDFYVRLFVLVRRSPQEAKKCASHNSHLLHCVNCKKFTLTSVLECTDTKFSSSHVTHSRCQFCNGRIKIAGPLWNQKLHEPEFVDSLLLEIEGLDDDRYNQKKRIKGLVAMIKEEIDSPLYFSIPGCCHILKCQEPDKLSMIAAIRSLGYNVSFTHCNPDALKSSIPIELFYTILKEWNELKGIKLSVDYKFASLPTIDFTSSRDMLPASKRQRLSRFPENPRNWGPMARHKASD